MKLIVGLGNPGKKYEGTRHNIGFMAIDVLAEAWADDSRYSYLGKEGGSIYEALKFHYLGLGEVSDKCALVKPLTFMNKSGEIVRDLVNYAGDDFEVASELWVIQDELDLPFGRIKIDTNASAAGHNGIQNIIDQLKTQEFVRVRVGVQNDKLDDTPGERFVLDQFDYDEVPKLPEILENIRGAVELGFEYDIETVQSRYNVK